MNEADTRDPLPASSVAGRANFNAWYAGLSSAQQAAVQIGFGGDPRWTVVPAPTSGDAYARSGLYLANIQSQFQPGNGYNPVGGLQNALHSAWGQAALGLPVTTLPDYNTLPTNLINYPGVQPYVDSVNLLQNYLGFTETQQLPGTAPPNPLYAIANTVTGTAADGSLLYNGATGLPPQPHPDASNQSLGPNLGGADGVIQAGDYTTAPVAPKSNLGPILLIGAGIAALLLLTKK